MLTSDDLAALKKQIVANEGLRTYLYDDATGKRITTGSIVQGHPTWGVGFNADAEGFSVAVIDAHLEERLATLVNEVLAALPWCARLPAGPLRAILDVGYNAGLDGLLGFHKMLGFAQSGNYISAAAELINSGLAPGRRERLAALMKS